MYSKDTKSATYYYFDYKFHLKSTSLHSAELQQETFVILANLISKWENFDQMMLNLEWMRFIDCLLARVHYLSNLIAIYVNLRFEICFIQFVDKIWLNSRLLSQSKICFAIHFDFRNLSWFGFKTGPMHYFEKSETNLQSLMHSLHSHLFNKSHHFSICKECQI